MLHHINSMCNILACLIIAVNDHVASKFVSYKNNVNIFIRSLDSKYFLSRPFQLALDFDVVPCGEDLSVWKKLP